MSDDSSMDESRSSWADLLLSEAGKSVFGGLLCLVALALLIWNESGSVARYRARRDGIASAVAVPAGRVDARREGHLVLVAGRATTGGLLHDADFGINVAALKLARVVEMYQWRECEVIFTEQKVGGPLVTNRTCIYERVWSEQHIPSSGFKEAAEHQNSTAQPYTNCQWTATPIALGAFTLSTALVAQISLSAPVVLGTNICMPAAIQELAKRDPEEIYIGQSQAQPRIGDIRIRFRIAPLQEISVAACQHGQTFAPYRTRRGRQIESLQPGLHTPGSWEADNSTEGRVVRWFLRTVAFFGLFAGGGIALGALVASARVRAVAGDLEESGVAPAAGIWAAVMTAAVLGTVWIWWRPAAGAALLAPVVSAGLLIQYRLRHPVAQGPRPQRPLGRLTSRG